MRAERNILSMGIRFVSAVSGLTGGVLLTGVKPMGCAWRLCMKFVPTGMELRGRKSVEELFHLQAVIAGLQLPARAIPYTTSSHRLAT